MLLLPRLWHPQLSSSSRAQPLNHTSIQLRWKTGQAASIRLEFTTVPLQNDCRKKNYQDSSNHFSNQVFRKSYLLSKCFNFILCDNYMTPLEWRLQIWAQRRSQSIRHHPPAICSAFCWRTDAPLELSMRFGPTSTSETRKWHSHFRAQLQYGDLNVKLLLQNTSCIWPTSGTNMKSVHLSHQWCIGKHTELAISEKKNMTFLLSSLVLFTGLQLRIKPC